ncbi:MAG: methyltransferase domain-containing protein [bacterium]|nr:methyltransferase domain-containing protein [bacterium]
MSYLETIYSHAARPKTDYPNELALHLKEMFQLKDGMTILDIGCGRGDFAEAFAGAGLIVHGVDRERAGHFPNSVTFTAADLVYEPLPYKDGTFDIVFSKSVIEHVTNPEHFIAENLRVLKPGGRLICLTPDWYTQMYIFWDDHTHQRPFTIRGMRDLLRIMEVVDVQAMLFYQLPVLWRYPSIMFVSKLLQLLGPVKKLHRNKFIRWSRELMILGTGTKPR